MRGSLASQYWTLTKPRVVALIVFTAIIGMLLAIGPGDVWPWPRLLAGTFGIWLAAAVRRPSIICWINASTR